MYIDSDLLYLNSLCRSFEFFQLCNVNEVLAKMEIPTFNPLRFLQRYTL